MTHTAFATWTQFNNPTLSSGAHKLARETCAYRRKPRIRVQCARACAKGNGNSSSGNASGSINGESGETSARKREEKSETTYISLEESRSRWANFSSLRPGGSSELESIAGAGVAHAIREVYTDVDTRMFIICGPGRNGRIGTSVASHLINSGYSVGVCIQTENRPETLPSSAVFFDFIPATLEYYYDVVIDAVLGTGYDGGDVEGATSVLHTAVCDTRLPVVSVDVPSAWDIHGGPRGIDVRRDEFVKARLLVSVDKPKLCARMFAGALHYIAPVTGELEGTSSLFATNASAFQGFNGEIYGKPGQFGATLFSKRGEKKVWVDIDEDMDLWDELD